MNMQRLADCDNIVIAGHTSPDGDCIGACMALGMWLKNSNKTVCVCLEGYHEKYNVIPGQELLYEGDIESLNPNVFISLDCGSLDRLGSAVSLFERAKTTINIDHHLGNTQFADENMVQCEKPSTCEILFHMMNGSPLVDARIASALYAGIIYDTGGFRHKPTTKDTHLAAAALLEFGIPFNDIYTKLLVEHTVNETRAFSKALSNLRIVNGYPISYTSLSQRELKEISVTTKNLDGIIDFIFSLDGVTVGLFFYEKEDGSIKASMRSKELDLNRVAKEFGGGGHKNAAGCTFHVDMQEAVEMLLKTVEGKFDHGM